MANVKDITTRIEQSKLTNATTLNELVSNEKIKKRFDEVLGKKAPQFISSLLSLTNAKPELKAADPKTVISAAMIAATLDLPINPNLGFAYIVPYGKVASFQMGWKGFVQLAIRTGLYQTMNAAELYEGELISNNRITGEIVIDESKKKSDKIVAYVAYFKLKTGFEKYLYMTVDQVKKHASRYSKSYSRPGTPWQINFDAMALKTVLKMILSKYAILSIEMQSAITLDQGVIDSPVESSADIQAQVIYPDGSDSLEPAKEENKNTDTPKTEEMENDAIEPPNDYHEKSGNLIDGNYEKGVEK
ncbi:MAG: recombinase RecT [Alphaproteobacteria bacterium]|nr:recombinase RecT [Alphaproteobacteria bacterium]